MNWNDGFSARYYATVVDPQSWKDVERFDIVSGSISRNDDSLRESADVDCVNRRPSGEQWIRIYLDARQGGATEHIPLFTGLATSPSWKINGATETNPLECYSVLKVSDDILLPRGWYAPAGANGAGLIADLLKQSTPAPVVISGESPRLQNYIVAEDGETCLSMVDKILTAIGWRIKILGDGTIVVCERSGTVSATYDSIHNDAIKPQVSMDSDWYDCPNVFRATVGDVAAVARDDSEESALSTKNRGREVWAEEKDCKISTSESLGEYAMRRLKELQRSSTTVSYSRRYNPNVLVGDMIRLNYPKQGVIGDYIVTSQSITLGFGAETSEEVMSI